MVRACKDNECLKIVADKTSSNVTIDYIELKEIHVFLKDDIRSAVTYQGRFPNNYSFYEMGAT